MIWEVTQELTRKGEGEFTIQVRNHKVFRLKDTRDTLLVDEKE